ncbi:MAG: dockerin type I domain-containing protein, partial [bacterium]
DFGWVADAPLDYASYRVGGGQWRSIFTADRSSDFTLNWGLSWNSLAEGWNEISLVVADKAGNVLVHSYAAGLRGFLFGKDTVPPGAPAISSSTHPSPSAWYSHNDPSLQWGIPSDVSGVAGFSFVLDSVSNTVPDEVSQGVQNSKQYTDVGDGIWYFHCRAVDGAGHWGPADHYTIRVDVTDPGPPEELTADPDGWTNVNSFSITWSDPEDVSGIAGAYYKLDTLPSFDTDGQFSWQQPLVIEVPEEGMHTLYLWLQDRAGNTNRLHTSSATLAYDSSGPVAGTISIEDGADETDTLVVTLTDLGAQDELSGVEPDGLMQFSNGGALWSPAEPIGTVKTDWDLTSYGGTSAPGLKTVYVRYRDAAGNWSEPFHDDILYNPPLQIVTTQLDPAIIDVPYSDTLEAVGGAGPYVWSVVSGSLPEGLNLSASSGAIAGTPTPLDTTSFTAYFTVEVVDTTQTSDTQDLSIVVSERMKGDVNGDGAIDILDAVTIVNMILGDSCATMEGDDCWAADWTGDGVLDILDVLYVINYILDQSGPLTKPSSSSRATVKAQEVFDEGRQRRKLIISLDSPLPIAGVQLRLRSDGRTVGFGTPQLTHRSRGMSVASHITDDRLSIVVYSVMGETIPAGSGPILSVPFSTQYTKPTTHNPGLCFEQVIVVGSGCQAIPVENESTSLKTNSLLPETWSLEQNYPNPFNPSTTIGYVIPSREQRAESREYALQTTLKIYNILGQEVRTLVDEVKEAGYHIVTWDGRDDWDREVSSGIYFYMLKAGQFTVTRRMVLLR